MKQSRVLPTWSDAARDATRETLATLSVLATATGAVALKHIDGASALLTEDDLLAGRFVLADRETGAVSRFASVAELVGADAALLAVLREALKAPCLCSFDYPAGGGPGYRRHVAPYGILFGRTYYLVGPERNRTEPVLWRLDRMSGVELGDAFAGAPPGFDLRDYAARSFGAFQETPERIALRFLPAAAAAARRFEFHPHQSQHAEPDGALVVRFEAGGLLELVCHLFSWGETVEILAPERLRTLMLEALETARARHTAPRSDPSGHPEQERPTMS